MHTHTAQQTHYTTHTSFHAFQFLAPTPAARARRRPQKKTRILISTPTPSLTKTASEQHYLSLLLHTLLLLYASPTLTQGFIFKSRTRTQTSFSRALDPFLAEFPRAVKPAPPFRHTSSKALLERHTHTQSKNLDHHHHHAPMCVPCCERRRRAACEKNTPPTRVGPTQARAPQAKLMLLVAHLRRRRCCFFSMLLLPR